MYQKGERRREEILRASLRLIGARGADSVTHRAVAEEAGVPVSATTYYFESKDQLLEEALTLAAREETERLERLVLDMAPLSLSVADWAAAIAAQIGAEFREDPGKHVALFELGLESTRTESLRAELARWQEAHLRLAELGCRTVGSEQPEVDARIVVATLTGLMLEQLVRAEPRFEEDVLRPALERLFDRLSSSERVAAHV